MAAFAKSWRREIGPPCHWRAAGAFGRARWIPPISEEIGKLLGGPARASRYLPTLFPNIDFWEDWRSKIGVKSLILLEPGVGFEPTTCGLQNRCSTTELTRQINDLQDWS